LKVKPKTRKVRESDKLSLIFYFLQGDKSMATITLALFLGSVVLLRIVLLVRRSGV